MVAMANPLESFIWGKGGAKMTPEQIAREREIAEALGVIDTSPVGHWTQGLARVVSAAAGAYRGHKANRAERENADFNSDLSSRLSSALFGGGSDTPSLAGGSAPSAVSAGPASFASSEDGGATTAASAAGVSQKVANKNPMELASTLVGKGEVPDRGTLMEYMKNGGVNLDPATTAWCAAFVNSSLGQAGIEGTGSNLARSFLDWGEAVDQPQRGDLAVFSRGDPNGWQGHVGFFDGLNPDGTIRVLGGNQSDQVSFADYSPEKLLGYRRAPGSAPAVDAANAMASGGLASQGVPVAETEADILAQEQAMAQQDPNAGAMSADPMATGSLPAPDANPSAPVASSLTGHMVNPDLPMAGGTSGFAQPSPQVAQALMGGQASAQMGGPADPMPGMTQALIEALSDPRTSDQNRRLAMMALNRQMQQQDPMRQLEMEMMQEKLNQLRNPQPEQTAEMQNLAWRAQQAGLQPGTPEYTEFMLTGGRPQDGVTVNNIMGGEKFGEEFAKGDAQALSEVSQSGLAATRNLGRIDRLSEILANTPQGAVASWQMIAGNYGLNTEGLSEIQAAQALINSLVPEQRPPGSGPMSDADLELFKQSLPRIINQPGGNEMIVNTMRAIAQYDAQGAEIVQALRRGEIDRAQAFDMLQGRENPLAALDDTGGNQGAGEVPAGVDPADWEYMTPEERALFQ